MTLHCTLRSFAVIAITLACWPCLSLALSPPTRTNSSGCIEVHPSHARQGIRTGWNSHSRGQSRDGWARRNSKTGSAAQVILVTSHRRSSGWSTRAWTKPQKQERQRRISPRIQGAESDNLAAGVAWLDKARIRDTRRCLHPRHMSRKRSHPGNHQPARGQGVRLGRDRLVPALRDLARQTVECGLLRRIQLESPRLGKAREVARAERR